MGKILKFEYYEKDKLNTRVQVDYSRQEILVENFTDDIVEQAFGRRKVTIETIDEFFRERVFPETRVNCKELLEDLGLRNFDAEAIARITHGVLVHDFNWIRFDDEKLSWEDILEFKAGLMKE
ncbi:MAG: hypothetical protein IJA32_09640 [Lachnospiraceae bacterium]|nr:hypothetical protein [Lachnospiraceae bacterium]